MDNEAEHKKMQVKVLYSFNNTSTVFLSRSNSLYPIRIARIPSMNGTEEFITLGGCELKSCIQQILNSSPENFHLQTEDYAVYYKDLTEQPDEPFVSNGVLSALLDDKDSNLIPGRVCQNVSASFLFGSKNESSSLTLEVRLKLHTIEKVITSNNMDSAPASRSMSAHLPSMTSSKSNSVLPQKRRNEQQQSHDDNDDHLYNSRQNRDSNYSHKSANTSRGNGSSVLPEKATRTKSLPAFQNPHLYNHMYNIRTADKLNTPSRYDSQSVLERFKLAPFVDAHVIDKPRVVKRSRHLQRQDHQQSQGTATRLNSMVEPMQAMRTRSMVTNRQAPLMISSPIHEEESSDTDDTEYNENNTNNLEADEDDEDGDEEDIDDDGEVVDHNTSPYTPQQPPYRPGNEKQQGFHSLPDFEDLDSKKTHTITSNKLPENHGLECINTNCSTTTSISWRFFEIGFHPNFFKIHRAEGFDKRNYEGMYGPLCNACYLFLRNKGFMRPKGVVKKYLKQQQYKKGPKDKEDRGSSTYDNSLPPPTRKPTPMGVTGSSPVKSGSSSSNHNNTGIRSNSNYNTMSTHRFATPSHTPSEINQAIQNSKINPSQNDLADFMNQLNNFGGPLTDIDPLPQDQLQGITPPMMATKCNTRVINIDQNGEDKENCPPIDVSQLNSSNSPARNGTEDFEKLIVKSFNHKSSPIDGHTEWMNSLFGEGPTPKDQVTPRDMTATNGSNGNDSGNNGSNNNEVNTNSQVTVNSGGRKIYSGLPQMKTFTTRRSPRLNKSKLTINNTMPSSPLSENRRGVVSEDKLFLDDSNLEMIEQEINSLTGNHPLDAKNNSNNNTSDSPQMGPPATRNNTTTLALSLSKPGSSPNSEVFPTVADSK